MDSCADRNTQAGLTIIEVCIALTIMIIMTGMAIFAMMPHKSAFRTDDEALQILNVMRQASQRALTQRQPHRLEIDLTDNVIKLIDENTSASDDDVEISSQSLYSSKEVKLSKAPVTANGKTTSTSQPANVSLPVAPAQPNFPAAVFTNNSSNHSVLTLRYMSDGRVVNSDGNMISATLFLWAPLESDDDSDADSAQLSKVRAISFFGPTGTTKLWAYTGTGTTFLAK